MRIVRSGRSVNDGEEVGATAFLSPAICLTTNSMATRANKETSKVPNRDQGQEADGCVEAPHPVRAIPVGW